MLQTGQILGNYRIERLLGTGGFAEVYEAEDPLLARKVAIKVVLAEFARTGDVLARFEREVRASAGLDHPGIVQIYAVGESDGINFYAMRLLGNGDLRKRIDSGLTPRRALEILDQLASALEHAHAQDIVHRDIKPENILFDEEDRPVLTDFGIAKVLRAQEKLTAAGTSVGTPHYLSPEQARGGAIDGRSDLYSLGVILFEMLTARRPFDAADQLSVIIMHATEPVPKLPAEHAQLQPLIDSLMAKHPGQRPESASALREQMQQMLRILSPATASSLAGAARIAPDSQPHRAPRPPTPPVSPPIPTHKPESLPVGSAIPPPSAPKAGSSRNFVPGLLAVAFTLLATAATWWQMREPSSSEPHANPLPQAAILSAPPNDRQPVSKQTQGSETREQQIAREKRRCALHVSTLTAEGNLVYDDALRLPGARPEADGSGVRVPNVRLANGQWVNALITPEGCVLIRSLAAGMPASPAQ